jgi:hypothetical protein
MVLVIKTLFRVPNSPMEAFGLSPVIVRTPPREDNCVRLGRKKHGAIRAEQFCGRKGAKIT